MPKKPRKRSNPIQGEYWIDDSGNAIFADGDVGDMNHEMVVADGLVRQFLDVMDIGAYEEHVGGLQDHEDEIRAWCLEEGGVEEDPEGYDPEDPDDAKWLAENAEALELINDDPIEFARDLVRGRIGKHFPAKDQFDDAWAIACGSGVHDAREYAMKYNGWKRVARHNVETWTLTANDLKVIADGLSDAAGGDEIDPDETFNIEVRSTRKYYTDVPWSDIDSGDVAAVTVGH
jgi:hypothetical protein